MFSLKFEYIENPLKACLTGLLKMQIKQMRFVFILNGTFQIMSYPEVTDMLENLCKAHILENIKNHVHVYSCGIFAC